MHPTYRAVWELVAAAGGPLAGAADPGWSSRLRDAAQERDDAGLVSLVSALAVEPLLTGKAPDGAYVAQHVVRLLELTALRRIADREVQAAAHRPRRGGRGLQPDVRRAGRSRGTPPGAARPDRRLRVSGR